MKKADDYVLFIDESGKSKFSDVGDHFLLCGLVINKDLNTALSNYMVSLKNKSGIPPDKNIHAFDLFEDEKIRGKRLKITKIITFFERLLRLIEGCEFRCYIVQVDKRPYINRIEKTARKNKIRPEIITKYLMLHDIHDLLYESLTSKLILEFGHFLHQEESIGEIMAESRRQDDHAALEAFVAATQSSNYLPETHYEMWSKHSFERIHGLTFQNKKGLSFGLEIADLFAWAHLNSAFGVSRPVSSKAKLSRINKRLLRVEKLLEGSLRKRKVETMTPAKIKTVASKRVTEFANKLKEYKKLSNFGAPTRSPW